MRIHHLNCGTDCPVGGALMDGRSGGLFGHLVCHCLLIETDNGLVLVDTGYGLQDVRRTYPRLSRTFKLMLNIHLKEQETAVRQVERLGFDPRDVRHIVVTHLDFDHVGGLEDFPEATVHVMADEMQAMDQRTGFVTRCRYRPMQLDNVHRWQRYAVGGTWKGFAAVSQLVGLPPEILLVPLHGHTRGHAGVAVQSGEGWLFHAGDAYFHHDELRLTDPGCPPGLRVYQRLMEVDRVARLNNQRRLRNLVAQNADIKVICAHDRAEFQACAGH